MTTNDTPAGDPYLDTISESVDDTAVVESPIQPGDILGIDIGGSGIKGAPVDVETGRLRRERYKVLTPEGAEPEDVSKVVQELVDHFQWTGPVGFTFPGPVRRGVVLGAANVSKRWVGVNADNEFTDLLGLPSTVVNDADAAGVAEIAHGAGKGLHGTVVMLTFGTGVGSAIFTDGQLLTNTEFGHLQMWGDSAERKVSASARERMGLSFEKWATEYVQEYFEYLDRLFNPDLFVVGGGISRKYEKWVPHIHVDAPIVPAQLRNNAGIVGAAMFAKGAVGAHTSVVFDS
jgi:polyphosphate glucokinase